MRRTSLLTLLLGLALTPGCDDAGTDATPDESTLTLTFTGLPALGSDYVYEGWIIVDGAPVTTGRFTVDDEGAASASVFVLDPDEADAATTFVLTLEPAVGDEPAPSAVHLLAGDLSDGAATLTVDHGAALGTDFFDAAGQFILETPSSGGVADDFDQGIWWLVPGATMTAGLDLPVLPAGWVYEGWVVGADGPVSTGRFTAADMADADGAGPDAGMDDAPPFPGRRRGAKVELGAWHQYTICCYAPTQQPFEEPGPLD